MSSNFTVETDQSSYNIREPDYPQWTSGMQGIILSSFFYGYFITQIPGGYFASHWDGMIIHGTGVLLASLLTLLTPLIVRVSNGALVPVILIRAFIGACEGVTLPSLQAVWSNWAPPSERSRLTTISFSGSHIGTVGMMVLASILAEHTAWDSIFYTSGGVALLWSFVWFLFVRNRPSDHPHISEHELQYIESSLGYTSPTHRSPDGGHVAAATADGPPTSAVQSVSATVASDIRATMDSVPLAPGAPGVLLPATISPRRSSKRSPTKGSPSSPKKSFSLSLVSTPWRAILCSLPVWAIVTVHCSFNFGYYVMFTLLPKFMHEVLHYDFVTAGFLESFPFLLLATTLVISGFVSDIVRQRGRFSLTNIRKVTICIPLVLESLVVIIIGFVPKAFAVLCIALVVALSGISWAGLTVNQLDIAPQYAGITMGISNTCATFASLLAPLLGGWIVNADPESQSSWRPIFYLCSVFYLGGALFYFLCGSAERQSWADPFASATGYYQRAQTGGESATVDLGQSQPGMGTDIPNGLDTNSSNGFKYKRWRDEDEEQAYGDQNSGPGAALPSSSIAPSTGTIPRMYGAGSGAGNIVEGGERTKIRENERDSNSRPYSSTHDYR